MELLTQIASFVQKNKNTQIIFVDKFRDISNLACVEPRL